MISADDALRRLKEGNRRYLSGAKSKSALDNQKDRNELAKEQTPFAVILGCSDSRVPPELIFDQSLGGLFVIRVAGNISGPVQVASVEFAVQELGTKLVMVLGHNRCGAVQATIDAVANPEAPMSSNLRTVADYVETAILPVLERGGDPSTDGVNLECVKANVRNSARSLLRRSRLLQRKSLETGFQIVEAVYSLETGVVTILDPEAADS